MRGQIVSHYRVIDEIGRGGMGRVYEAEDERLRRTVALKFLPPESTDDTDAKQRFVQEAQAASALDHPNICTIHEIDQSTDGRLFLVMPRYRGETFRDRVALYDLLGTPPDDKRWRRMDAGHLSFPRPELVRETVDWLDKYLGPVD